MSLLDILLIIAGVGYLLVRRMTGQLVEVKSLLVLPLVLTGIGLGSLHKIGTVSATTAAFVAIGIVISVVLGVLRGASVHLGVRNGELWMRYRVATVVLWVVNLVAKVALLPLEHSASAATATAVNHTLLFSVGLGVLAESVVVGLRALRSDAIVVWQKGKDGHPHRTSPAFERARAWVADDDDRPLSVRLQHHDW